MLSIPDRIQIRCFTDNKSIVEHISTSTTTVKDFRLRVDVACLRDMLKRGEIGSVQWVDTHHQLADCLTKATASCKSLIDVLKQNKIDRSLYLNMQTAYLK